MNEVNHGKVSEVTRERVREYNNNLNHYKEMYANLNAEKKLLTEQLETGCKELSQRLGIEVTLDNLDQVIDQKTDEMSRMLENGEAIINRIKAKENGNMAGNNMNGMTGTAGTAGNMNGMANNNMSGNMNGMAGLVGNNMSGNMNGMPVNNMQVNMAGIDNQRQPMFKPVNYMGNREEINKMNNGQPAAVKTDNGPSVFQQSAFRMPNNFGVDEI